MMGRPGEGWCISIGGGKDVQVAFCWLASQALQLAASATAALGLVTVERIQAPHLLHLWGAWSSRLRLQR